MQTPVISDLELLELLSLPAGTRAHIEQLASAAIVYVLVVSKTISLVLPREWFNEPEIHGFRMRRAVQTFRDGICGKLAA